MFSIEAEERNIEIGVQLTLPFYHIILRLPVNTVLWSENCTKPAVRSAIKDLGDMIKIPADAWRMA